MAEGENLLAQMMGEFGSEADGAVIKKLRHRIAGAAHNHQPMINTTISPINTNDASRS